MPNNCHYILWRRVPFSVKYFCTDLLSIKNMFSQLQWWEFRPVVFLFCWGGGGGGGYSSRVLYIQNGFRHQTIIAQAQVIKANMTKMSLLCRTVFTSWYNFVSLNSFCMPFFNGYHGLISSDIFNLGCILYKMGLHGFGRTDFCIMNLLNGLSTANQSGKHPSVLYCCHTNAKVQIVSL